MGRRTKARRTLHMCVAGRCVASAAPKRENWAHKFVLRYQGDRNEETRDASADRTAGGAARRVEWIWGGVGVGRGCKGAEPGSARVEARQRAAGNPGGRS